MKNKTTTKKMLLAVIIALTAVSELFAQGNGQNNSNGLWQAKGQDTVSTNREVLVNKNIKVVGNAYVDSIKTNILKVGSNSLWLGVFNQNTGTNNNISADNGDLFLQSITGSNFNTIINANNTGKVGIGTTNPQSQLHINDGTYATFQMTNATTGANANDGFKLAVNNQNQALMAQFEESPIRFLVNDNAPGNILTKERMRITTAMVSQHGNPPAPVTRVSIPNKGYAPITNPVSLLHMGEPAGLGYRSWMDVGTFMGYHTDNMYVGLFDRNPYTTNHDMTDAVINWGDDYDYTQLLPNTGPDDLVFIFTDNYSSTVPSSDDKNPHSTIGAEVARMSFRGFFGSMGICTPNPKARLHITASNPDQVLPYAPDHRLQMRLSFDIRSNTDFRVLEKKFKLS